MLLRRVVGAVGRRACAAAATAAEDGTVVISGGPEVEFDAATLTAISESVAAIRNQYAQ